MIQTRDRGNSVDLGLGEIALNNICQHEKPGGLPGSVLQTQPKVRKKYLAALMMSSGIYFPLG